MALQESRPGEEKNHIQLQEDLGEVSTEISKLARSHFVIKSLLISFFFFSFPMLIISLGQRFLSMI